MNEQKLQAFVQWLPTRFEEFQNKTMDEVVQSLNELYNSGEEGQRTLQELWITFERENQEGPVSASMLKKGGKLEYIEQFKKGGKSKKRKCKCGCDIVSVKEKGGVIEKCACGCKVNKIESHQGGGALNQNLNIQRQHSMFAPRMGQFTVTGNQLYQGLPSKQKITMKQDGGPVQQAPKKNWRPTFNRNVDFTGPDGQLRPYTAAQWLNSKGNKLTQQINRPLDQAYWYQATYGEDPAKFPVVSSNYTQRIINNPGTMQADTTFRKATPGLGLFERVKNPNPNWNKTFDAIFNPQK